ncbi:MAG: C25 family cysteine peptidase [Methanobacteriota archaeon]
MGGVRSTSTLFLMLVIFLLTIPYSIFSPSNTESLTACASSPLSFSENNIIITDAQFYDCAQELALFHQAEGLSSLVINTSWIYTQYPAAEDPPIKGYGQGILSKLFINKQYNYVLAKKIISFLRDQTMHPALEYVTLFGDGRYLPASYYMYSQLRNSIPFVANIMLPDFYNNRIASDFFYCSPDYDFEPDFKVGRIPVSNTDEAALYVEKVQRWRAQVNWSWFQNVFVAGDQPDLPEEMDLDGCYAGEMIAVDAINQGYFQGMNVTKLFLTENTFTKLAIENVMNAGQAGFLYVMAHGSVDRWATYDEPDPFVYGDDLLQFSENNQIPIVVSVACMSGAFDTTIAHPYWIARGQASLGESILFSPGAGVAYVGTTRATLGSPLLRLEDGELNITKERGIAGMLTYFFEAYHQNITMLGDLTYAAINRYIMENDFPEAPEKDEAFVVLMSFVLLGDPALRLPSPQLDACPSYEQPRLDALGFEGLTSEANPRPWYYTNTPVQIMITTNSSDVTVKRINIDTDQVVDRENLTLLNNSGTYSFVSSEPARYLIRVSSLDGKEGWLYLTTRQS